MSRAAEALAGIPLATRCIMALCILTYAYQLLVDPPLRNYTMCPQNVLHQHEYYRIVTSSLFHGSLMHIGMNMMSTMAIGTMLEKKHLGTFMMGITILWGIFLTSFVYVLISWLLMVVVGYKRMMLQHSLGFSGVIFQLSVMESNLSPNRTRNIFGLLQVSSKMYPWALLVVLQFVMPQISFLGHLSGILTGTLQYYGVLDCLFPSVSCLREFEVSDRLAMIRSQAGYVVMPENVPGRETPDILSAILGAFGSAALLVSNICETIKVCIFGRGADANANIQMGELGAVWGSSDASVSGGEIEDDDEWVGLPMAIQRSTEQT